MVTLVLRRCWYIKSSFFHNLVVDKHEILVYIIDILKPREESKSASLGFNLPTDIPRKGVMAQMYKDILNVIRDSVELEVKTMNCVPI